MPDERGDDDADDETELTFDKLVIELGVDELLVVAVAPVFEIIMGGSGARRSGSVVGRCADLLLSLDVETEAEAAESDCDEDDVGEMFFSNFSLICFIL